MKEKTARESDYTSLLWARRSVKYVVGLRHRQAPTREETEGGKKKKEEKKLIKHRTKKKRNQMVYGSRIG
jgi:hypothetical protein